MAPIVRRAAAAPPPQLVNFGDLDADYSAGGGLPEGDYRLTFDVMMEPPRKDGTQSNRQPRLGVLLTATPINAAGQDADEPKTKFYSFGGKAHLSYAPDPNTGKGIIAIPGGAGVQPSTKSNWAMLLKSMYDSGMPKGVFTNDVSVMDNVLVHMHEVPEPEERKSYGRTSKTGEAALDVEEERQGNGKVSIVSEIKGGVEWWEEAPAAAPAAPVRAAAKAPALAPKPAAAAARKPATAPAPPAAEEVDLSEVAINAVGEVLGTSPTGLSKVALKTKTFTFVKTASDDATAQAVIDTYFGTDADLNGLLNQLDYGVSGVMVKPTA